jgi:hypothetical protein
MNKYIITKNNEIIVFTELLNHSDFSKFHPISAGFISFGIDKEGNITCSCYGSSFTLGLSSRPEEDTKIAKRQLNLIF